MIGSRARREMPADAFSDLDLLIATTDPERYTGSAAWLGELGRPRLTFLEATAVGGLVERRVLFEGGLDVDFVPIPPRVFAILPPPVQAVFRRGYRVIVDKDGLEAAICAALGDPRGEAAPAHAEAAGGDAEAGSEAVRPPARAASPDDFRELVHDFLYHAVWTAKKLARGELWTAKMCCDGYMKQRLLRLLEWHRGATAEDAVDTWHDGRFLDSWADPAVLAELRGTFARYETAAVWDALEATVALFRRLAEELAARKGFSYPRDADDYALGLVRAYRTGRGALLP